MEQPVLVPEVQKIEMCEGTYAIPKKVTIGFNGLEAQLAFFLKDWLTFTAVQENGDIRLTLNTGIAEQGYRITITDYILIEYSTPRGAFYAFTTLKQLVLGAENISLIPKIIVEDWPDIENRGIMLDVSRGRMTKIEVIKKVIEWIAALKYNQFQLYFDSIVYDYPGLEEYTAGWVVYTVDEIRELNEFCTQHFVDLVPNQNSFAHMDVWLKQPGLSHLAITKDETGEKSGTLNPLNPESLEFMDKVYGSLLPNFDGKLVNIGCDEAWEIGQGETKEECDKICKGQFYLNYLMKLHDLIADKYMHTPMFWDDIALNYPELVYKLPKDMILIEWGYEFDHPFDEHCKIIHDHSLRFYVSPGTATWNSICGRTVNMLENVRCAGVAARKYGAEGFLLTDWGDGGRPQPMAPSIISYVVGSIYGWHTADTSKDGKESIADIARQYADKYIFKADSGFSDLIMRLGKTCHLEHERRLNATGIWERFRDAKPLYNPVIKAYAAEIKNELQNYTLRCDYNELIKQEVYNTCLLLMIVADPLNMKAKAEQWKNEYIRLWDIRSMHDPKGYGENTFYMDRLIKTAEEQKTVETEKTDIIWFF